MSTAISEISPPRRPYRMSARAETTAATNERLLAAAWRHFATVPYEGVKLREIAAEAAVTAQTLHARFGSKERLLIAAFLWWGQHAIARRETAPVGDVEGAIAVLFDHYEEHGAAILRMLSQEDRFPALRQLTDAGRAYHRAWAARVFAPLLRGLPGATRERRLLAVVVATDLLAWKLLRLDMHVDRLDAERIVAEMVESPSPCEEMS